MKLPLSFTVKLPPPLSSSSPHPRKPMDSTPSASLPLSFSGGGGDMDVGDALEAAGTKDPVD
jgi:hypothetical protein